MKKEEGLTLTTRERFARIKILHRLIELETELQLKQISNLLKNVSYEYARYDRWWGGAVQVGPEQDGNWIWIESGVLPCRNGRGVGCIPEVGGMTRTISSFNSFNMRTNIMELIKAVTK